MRIVIFGASGKTGSLLVKLALEAGHEVKVYVRDPSKFQIERNDLKVIVGQLNNTEKLREAIHGAEICISTLAVGTLTKTFPEVNKGIDNIVRIMEEEKVPRLLYMSSLGVGDSRLKMPQPLRFLILNLFLRVPIAAHNKNEDRIRESKLNWTIIRPGGLTDGPQTGKYLSGTDLEKIKGNASISRANVAAFMLEQLTNENSFKKNIWLYQ
jgi:putative NADH-flavin reductase